MYSPVNPSLTISKWGLRGYKSHGLVILMFQIIFLFKPQLNTNKQLSYPSGVLTDLLIVFTVNFDFVKNCLMYAKGHEQRRSSSCV